MTMDRPMGIEKRHKEPGQENTKPGKDLVKALDKTAGKINKGLKAVGSAPSKVEKGAKKGVKKVRKLIGLKDGGLVKGTSGEKIARGLKDAGY